MTTSKQTTVFIVDDSTIQRSMLADYLAKYPNLFIREFSNGEYLIKELIVGSVQEPDVVLMDYFLDVAPGSAKDGVEILRKLKEIAPNVKVIMLTSVNNDKVKDLAKNAGAIDYVVKDSTGYQHLDEVLEKHGIVTKVAQA